MIPALPPLLQSISGPRRPGRALAWAGALLLAAAAVYAAAASPPRFEDVTQVVSVQVPVEVVTRDGVPVRGLTAADFEIFDEGKKQQLKSFRVVDLDVLEPRGVPLGALPAEAQQLEPSARRHFLLLFDLSFARPSTVLRGREAARDFVLRSLRPTDLAAIATYSVQTGPRLVVTFTPDRAQLARGILSLGLDNVDDAVKPDPLRFVIAPPSAADLASGGTQVRPDSRRPVDQLIRENLELIRREVDKADRAYSNDLVKNYMKSLSDLAKVLDAVKGRKHVVLFSEGFDSRLLVGHDTSGGEAQADNFNIEQGNWLQVDNDTRYGSTQLQSRLWQMVRDFKRADCVIEAVDIAGLQARGDASDNSREDRPNGEEELFEMAHETGGELLKDSNDFGAQLEHVLARSTVTYLLTFERSDLKADGSFRSLEVKARVPAGVRLSYRSGYYAPRPFRQLDPLSKVLLAGDGIASAAPRADLDVNVLVSPFRAQPKRAYVPIIVEVGGASLTAAHKGDRLNVEIYAYVSDRQGQMQDYFTQRVAVDLKKAGKDALGAGLKYYGHVDLPAGDYRVRILVRDTESGRTGVQSAALSIPAYEAGEPALLTPFFIDSRSGWLMVRERTTAEAGKQAVVYPFTVNGQPYIPAALPALAGTELAKLCLVAYNLGSGDLALQGKVVGNDGVPRPGGSLELVARTATGVSGLDKLLATFKPTGLDAGRYVLQVAVTDPRTGRQGMSSVPFQVIR